MTRLSVAALASPYCATYKQADQLFNHIAVHLRGGEAVELDFEKVELASSSFFNELLGRITDAFGQEVTEKRLSYFALKPRHKFVLERTRHITPA
jgi:hypothetical protein